MSRKGLLMVKNEQKKWGNLDFFRFLRVVERLLLADEQ